MNTLQTEGLIAYQLSSYYGGGHSHRLDKIEDVYLKGKRDGAQDKEIELIKMGKALYELAFKKVQYLTGKLIQSAKDNDINVYEFHLKIENWDCLKSIIIVDIEDFSSDKIEALYKVANEISDELNNDDFHWDYSITYASDNINIDKIRSDGFTYYYEHVSRPRPA